MIKSAPFSFVRFEHPSANDYSLDIPFSLPVFDKHNTAFHFLVTDDRPVDLAIRLGLADTAGTFFSSFGIAATILSYRYKLTVFLTPPSIFLNSITWNGVTTPYIEAVTRAQLVRILEEDYGVEIVGDVFYLSEALTISIDATNLGFPLEAPVPYFWAEGYAAVSGVTVEGIDCFTYALLDDDDTVLAYSNNFKPVTEEHYTSLFTYSCKESAFGFTYPGANVIRLPVYLLKPDWPTKRVVNRQSTGRTQLLSATVEKQYAIETEHMPEVFHECLRVALLHDTVIIENKNIREVTVEVIESADYSAQWNDELKLSYAQGKGTLKVASFGFTNSNC